MLIVFLVFFLISNRSQTSCWRICKLSVLIFVHCFPLSCASFNLNLLYFCLIILKILTLISFQLCSASVYIYLVTLSVFSILRFRPHQCFEYIFTWIICLFSLAPKFISQLFFIKRFCQTKLNCLKRILIYLLIICLLIQRIYLFNILAS